MVPEPAHKPGVAVRAEDSPDRPGLTLPMLMVHMELFPGPRGAAADTTGAPLSPEDSVVLGRRDPVCLPKPPVPDIPASTLVRAVATLAPGQWPGAD